MHRIQEKIANRLRTIQAHKHSVGQMENFNFKSRGTDSNHEALLNYLFSRNMRVDKILKWAMTRILWIRYTSYSLHRSLEWVRTKYFYDLNILRTGDVDLRFYITTVQDGWRKSAFLTRACFPCTIYLFMQFIEPVSVWSCWRMFIETWPHSELTCKHRASSI